MARTVNEIYTSIITAKESESDLSGLTSDSNRAIWRLWAFITASCIAIFEQIMDVYVSTIETFVSKSPSASTLWIQDKMFKFQYDATNPQIVQLVDLAPQYPVVDATKRIITACSVTSGISNVVNVKIAKSNPYEALTSPELSAAQSYINTIGIAGITYTCISLDADKIYIDAEVYYTGQYSAIIQDSVITALNDYLQTLSLTNFDGSIKMSDLEAVIRNVAGVTDVVMNNVKAREDAVVFALGTDLILNNTLIQKSYASKAGYIVQETTSGQTFADSLTFTAI
jgi:hypothetical protein